MERSARDLPTKSPGSISRSKARSHARHLALAESDARFRANSTPRPTPPAPPPSRRGQEEEVPKDPSDATQEWRSDQLSPWERRVKLRSSSDSSGHRREEVLSRNAAPLPNSSSMNLGALSPTRRLRISPLFLTPQAFPRAQGGPRTTKHPKQTLRQLERLVQEETSQWQQTSVRGQTHRKPRSTFKASGRHTAASQRNLCTIFLST